MTFHLRFAATSDVGRVRRDNQDSGYAGPHLIAVADGVGGAARGDIASSATVDALRKLDVPAGEEPLGALAATIQLAHDRLAEIVESHAELDGTSTTLTAAVFDGSQLHVGHVGDSRGYLLRDGVLDQITSDHSLVQSLVDEGRITEEEARVHPHRNLILKAIDSVHEPEPDLFSVPLQAGDRLLFCSDGCSGVLTDTALTELLTGEDLEATTINLVHSALDAGSSDNVTVVMADVLDGDLGSPSAPVVVGAATLAPHLQIPDDTTTGNLSDHELEELSQAALDPETIRYAPLPPPRRVWLRRLIVVILALGLLGGAGYGAYAFSQTQHFLKSDPSGQVILYRGVDLTPLGFKLYQRELDTGYNLAELGDIAPQVKDGHYVSKNKAIGYLEQACVQAQQSVEVPEPPTPFGIGRTDQGPLTTPPPTDCTKGP